MIIDDLNNTKNKWEKHFNTTLRQMKQKTNR